MEHRTWMTRHRGVLFVHAGKELDPDALPREGPPLVFGAIIGSVELVSVTGEPGNYLWQLADPLLLVEPIPARGWPSLWRWSS